MSEDQNDPSSADDWETRKKELEAIYEQASKEEYKDGYTNPIISAEDLDEIIRINTEEREGLPTSEFDQDP